MKYKVTLNGKTYEVEVEKGEAVLLKEYEAAAPAAPVAAPVATAPAAPVAAPVATAPAAPAAPAAAPAAASVQLGAGTAVNAPLPGTVLQIKASVGQAVKAGETVMIIEAMKMENEIVAPKDGKITSVVVQKGAAVNAGDPLFTIA